MVKFDPNFTKLCFSLESIYGDTGETYRDTMYRHIIYIFKSLPIYVYANIPREKLD